MKYRHIIWDWNGTLLNDVDECITVANELLRRRGLPELTREKYLAYLDFPVINFYRLLGFDFQKESYKDVAHEYMDKYVLHVPKCRLQEGAREVLQQLTEAGFTHSVLSAYHQKRLEEAVNHFKLNSWFIKLIGLDDYYAHSKLEYGKKWINELEYSPEEIVFIGDTRHDYDVAQELGVDCILLSCGHQSPERLKDCGSELFDSLRDVQTYLLQRSG